MDALDVLCAQLTCDLFTIAKFLVVLAVNDCFMTQSPDLKKTIIHVMAGLLYPVLCLAENRLHCALGLHYETTQYNRKSYMVYRTAPFSMTLIDPKPRFQGPLLDAEYLRNG